MEFRKEAFEVTFQYWLCEDTGDQFTNTELDEVNVQQVYNQYRDRHNIPFPAEIEGIRRKYGVSAHRMAEVLGFGVNTYRQYEAGEVPSVSNARLIQMASDTRRFIQMVELCETLDEKARIKLTTKAEELMREEEKHAHEQQVMQYLLGKPLPDQYSGYRSPNYERMAALVCFFAERLHPFKTKLNKLLFYADFLAFKGSCFSITGVRYRAIDMGPVPNNFNSLYERMEQDGLIAIEHLTFPQGYEGEQFFARMPFDAEQFTPHELAVMEQVAQRFEKTTTHEIVELSHQEEAWKQNQGGRKAISYNFAFELKDA